MAGLSQDELRRQMELARGHLAAGRVADAENGFLKIVATNGDDPDGWAYLGLAHRAAGRYEMAARATRRAAELEPGNAGHWNNLGTFLHELSRFGEAAEAYERAVGLRADFAGAYLGLSATLQAMDRMDEAIAACRRGIEAGGAGDPAMAYANLGSALRGVGLMDEAVEAFRKGISLAPKNAALHGNLLYSLWYHPGYDMAAIQREHAIWNQRHALPLAALRKPHGNSRDPNRRLRVGYISPDFRQHTTGLNLVPLFGQHDHKRFHITAYADVIAPDWVTGHIQKHCDAWRSITDRTDEQLAEMVREDQIDILVDLTQHMARNRLLAFARKPAPVQVAFAGYPATTGLTAMDYRISDSRLDPGGSSALASLEAYYSEKTLRLPGCWWCYNGLATGAEIGALPAVSNGFITFGCLNNFCKVNEATLDLWSGTLRAVADSRLILMAPGGQSRDRILGFLEKRGVGALRVEFVGRQGFIDYLATFNRIDICLDTIPYNGHTTSLDSLWMGVPVVALAGGTPVGRAGVSQLGFLGLEELIAYSPEEFTRIAAGLAGDMAGLRNLRGILRVMMKRSPLLDDAGFARGVEGLFVEMWGRHCAGGGPESATHQ